MNLPTDLKSFSADDLGAFQIMEPSLAYDLFWAALIVACIVL